MLTNEKRIVTDRNLDKRDDVFEKIAELSGVSNKQQVIEGLIDRENQVSTGFENGIAIPHTKVSEITEPMVFVLRVGDIVWPSMDKLPTNLVISILVPENGENDHLKILGELTRKLIDLEFLNNLKTGDETTVANLINSIQISTPKVTEISENGEFYLGVTKCPVGIAHTYLAAEALEKKAKELGCAIKVETQGSAGVENKITSSDVAKASGVIIAADVAIEGMERFDGLPLIDVKIKRALHETDALFEEIKVAPVKHIQGSQQVDEADDGSVIKYIMNGVSYMIPFVVVGGLLIALSLSIGGVPTPDGLQIPEGSFFNKTLAIGSIGFTLMIPILAGFIASAISGRAALAPAMIGAMVANDPTILGTEAGTGFLGALVVGLMAGYLVKWINSWKVPKELRPIMPIFVIPIIGSLVISFIFIIFLGQPIATLMDVLNSMLEYLASNPALSIVLGMMLGAMVAADMGGPINKTAFLFGLATIPTSPEIMASVASAIAVPPLSMGLATLIGKNKFTEEERGMGIAALLMGFIGITEGAIPFAAGDPKRVIPSIIVGSMVASSISLLLGITSTVPHGGPIVGILGVTSNMFLYFAAIIAGTLVSTFMVLALKSKKN